MRWNQLKLSIADTLGTLSTTLYVQYFSIYKPHFIHFGWIIHRQDG